MHRPNQRFYLIVMGLGLLLSCPVAKAAKIAGFKAGVTTSTATPGELSSLQQAYAILEKADHDYKGHRAKAMHSIEAACKELGGSARGDGKGGEAQNQSDSQLQQAETLLRSARASAGTSKHEKVQHHIDHAIQELTEALAVK